MTPEQELEEALLEVCARAASESQISLVTLRRGTLNGGALSFTRRLLERHGATSPGYRYLVQAGRFDLTLESLVLQARFRALFTESERIEARARLVDSIAASLNHAAPGRPIGTLQGMRSARLGLETVSALFDGRTIKRLEGYAYHVGGSEELQFHIALVGFGREPWFRYGVAFGMQPLRIDSDLSPFRPRIARFNEFVNAHPERFTGLQVQHHYGGEVTTYDPGPIPAHFVRAHATIFLGVHVPFDELAIDRVLACFDSLMPLYHYVETGTELEQAGRSEDGRTEDGRTEDGWTLGHKAPVRRPAAGELRTTVDSGLRRRALREALLHHLERIHGRSRLRPGADDSSNADVTVHDNGTYTYYGVSTALTARGCLRQALGRLMDDAFWPDPRPGNLVVVGEPALDAGAVAYLEHLRAETGLTVHYRQLDLERGELG